MVSVMRLSRFASGVFVVVVSLAVFSVVVFSAFVLPVILLIIVFKLLLVALTDNPITESIRARAVIVTSLDLICGARSGPLHSIAWALPFHWTANAPKKVLILFFVSSDKLTGIF